MSDSREAGLSHFDLRCTECGSTHQADMATLECTRCGAPLDVHYADVKDGFQGVQPAGWQGPPIPTPLHDDSATVSIGEGGTPTVPLPALGFELGLSRLYAKLEFVGPTGSFKDRGTGAMISVARELGVTELVEDSSGNAGASVSAYAARAGIKAHIFAPFTAPRAKLQQIRAYGAETHSIDGPREAATDAAVDFYKANGLVYASHNLSPYFIEGTKTFAYEVAHQFPGRLPDHIVMPVGNGSLFIGAWKGFRELIEAGHVSSMPRLHAIQADAVMPLAAAFQGNAWTPDPSRKTIAGGISVGAPPRLNQALKVLNDTGGTALAVSDNDIVIWHGLVARREGLYVEPTSAAAFAGLEKLVEQGLIGTDEIVLVPITGSGLKDAPPA